MPAPNIPAAKRAGLPVDIDRLASEGDEWLTPEERYALKTYGVCAQLQPGMFMVRVRFPGGRITTRQARALAAIGDRYTGGWLHLTTRQNVELHSVGARDVPAVLRAIVDGGMSTQSACGHTLRNVMSCPDAGVTLDEPFDCFPDAQAVSDALLARGQELNCQLPSRINIAFGGCERCAAHAWINDLAFVSTERGGVAGYRVLAGGSLGTAPALAIEIASFIPRSHAVPAAMAVAAVFIAHGDFENPKKARMKFLVEAMGEAAFRDAFTTAFASELVAAPTHTEGSATVPRPDYAQLLASVPDGGWAPGVRPQLAPGLVSATVNVPLGDLDGDDMRLLADAADAFGGGLLHVTGNQNIVLRDVEVGRVGALRALIRTNSLDLAGSDGSLDVRACTGSRVCALGITDSPGVGDGLRSSMALARNSALRVHVSGCPNSCAQHQVGDIGLSGAKVRIGGKTRLGYHVWLGADLEQQRVGEVVGRCAAEDVTAVVDSLVGAWEALRARGETLSGTVQRIGHQAFAAHLAAIVDGSFEAGVDAEEAPSLLTV
jgi:sulfite reductase beta subunit-like hemoprotein